MMTPGEFACISIVWKTQRKGAIYEIYSGEEIFTDAFVRLRDSTASSTAYPFAHLPPLNSSLILIQQFIWVAFFGNVSQKCDISDER